MNIKKALSVFLSLLLVICIMPFASAEQGIAANGETQTYTISYNLVHGSLPDGASNPTQFTQDTPTFTLVEPVREGYIFAGWTGTLLDGAVRPLTIYQGSTGNRAYCAYWLECEHPGEQWVDNNDATLFRDGTSTLTCDVCGYSETVVNEGTAGYHSCPFLKIVYPSLLLVRDFFVALFYAI